MALLAALLLGCNQLVTAEYLAEVGWDKPPASPRSNVRTCVWALREILQESPGRPERLLTEPGGYRLLVAPGELDLTVFEDLVENARRAKQRTDYRATAENLHRALDLWCGTPLAGQPLGRTLSAEVARLMERRASVIEQYVEARVWLGESGMLIADLERWVAEYPFRETLWAELMRALHRSGRQAEALAAYRRARNLLVEEIGVEPGRILQQLHHSILNDGRAGEFTAQPEFNGSFDQFDRSPGRW